MAKKKLTKAKALFRVAPLKSKKGSGGGGYTPPPK